MTSDPDTEFLLDPAGIEGPLDLLAAQVAHRYQQAALAVRDGLRDLSGAAEAPPAFLARAARLLPRSEGLVRTLEPAYQAASAHQRQVAAERAAREAFLSALAQGTCFVGSDTRPRTYSHLGWIDDHPEWSVAAARDHGLLALVGGKQGVGKTILATLLIEGCLGPRPPLTAETTLPTAAVFFHIEEHDRLPQLLDGLRPNPTERDLALLRERLGVGGRPIGRLRFAAPEHLLGGLRPRLEPYEELGLEVLPIQVHPGQLGQPALEAALGAEDGARYVQRMLEAAEDQGGALDLAEWRALIDEADDLDAGTRRKAQARLRRLSQIAGPPDGPGLWQLVEPEVTTVFYLGGPHLSRGAAAPLVVGLMNALMRPSPDHGAFQRLIIVDEADLFGKDPLLWRAAVRGGRLIRHLGSTLMLMGQDLMEAPDELFGLAGLCALGRLSNPRVWQHWVERVGGLSGWRFADVERLLPGEMLLCPADTTDPAWRGRARRVRMRPPCCMHGGYTRGMI